jgi:phosphoenolpyruvate-protein phosphotransferase (PTS system enzyme I)
LKTRLSAPREKLRVPAPVELKGRPASPGIAAGLLFRLDAEISRRLPTGDPSKERAALRQAITKSIKQIVELMASAEEHGAAILEFQKAMLEDDELIAPALASIGAGNTAEAGWLAAIGDVLSGFETSEDDYFRARSADLMDLRDRVLRNLSGADLKPPPPGAILAGGDLTPTRFLETDWSAGGGIALSDGSSNSHVAMLARSRGVPMVVGLGTFPFDGHVDAIVDGRTGEVVLSPGEQGRRHFDRRRAAMAEESARAAGFLHRPAVTANGTRIAVMINVARPEEVDAVDVATCDGVGLMRTEFLFGGDTLPDEERQYQAYAKVLDWAEGRLVTIRTIDAGGDKPVKGLTVDEPNPFLGLRGIRLSLARPEVFRIQLRALARAGRHGKLKVMLPMVTVPEELTRAAAMMDEAVAELAAESILAVRPPLGIMVEVPAVAIAPERFSHAAFFSIGSNDLTQYVTAAARDSIRVAELNDITNPAVMRLIQDVASFGIQSGIDVSLCGDAAGEPALAPMLLKAGLRSLSVAPTLLGAVKAAIAEVRLDG